MLSKTVSGLVLILVLTGMLTLAFNVQPASSEWTGTVYIRADGSIDPPDAPIITYDNITYTLTDNITSSEDGIVVERDNIVIDGVGYTIQGIGAYAYKGVDLDGRSNVTIKNITITKFWFGIYLEGSSKNTIVGDTIKNNLYGIWLESSSTNTISGNNIISNVLGIDILGSYYNTIVNNTFIEDGLYVQFSYSNIVVDNKVNDKPLIYLEGSANVIVQDAGQIILINCENITIENLNLSKTDTAIQLLDTKNSRIKNNIISNSIEGIHLTSSSNNTINASKIENNWHGITLDLSSNNMIDGNNVTKNEGEGILIHGSTNNTLKNNWMFGNGLNFDVRGLELSSYINDVDESNMVDGKPVIYWVNRQNEAVPAHAGYVAIVNSTNIIVKNVKLARNGQGVLLAYTNTSRIENITAIKNWDGITLLHSSDNLIIGNNVTNNYGNGIDLSYLSNNNTVIENSIIKNDRGVYLGGILKFATNEYLGFPSDNKIYHNNFIDNQEQVFIWGNLPNNTWDDGYPSGGNYWSDYTGVDLYSGPYQNLTGNDGIGDTPYIIDMNNIDRYPLMQPVGPIKTVFDVIWDGITYSVLVVSNSTVTDFNFGQPLKQISFNVAGPDGTVGFCNVTIPKNLLKGEPWLILLDGMPISFTLAENTTHTMLYFTYAHSTHNVRIVGTEVLPPSPDTTPPLISTPFQKPEPDKVTPDQAVTVSVNVTDTESGVKSVILSYTRNSGAAWNNLTMLYNATTGLYQAAIPAFPSGTTVCYTIIAYDNAGNIAINDNAGQYYCYTVSAPVPLLSASISPLSNSILVGQSVTFTSTVSGGYPPYSYQWYLNDNPVSGATSNTWTFTPSESGIFYVYLKVTDDEGNTAQSETARITVAAVPVGGYSYPINKYTLSTPIATHIALTAILTAIFITIKWKTKRKH